SPRLQRVRGVRAGRPPDHRLRRGPRQRPQLADQGHLRRAPHRQRVPEREDRTLGHPPRRCPIISEPWKGSEPPAMGLRRRSRLRPDAIISEPWKGSEPPAMGLRRRSRLRPDAIISEPWKGSEPPARGLRRRSRLRPDAIISRRSASCPAPPVGALWPVTVGV